MQAPQEGQISKIFFRCGREGWGKERLPGPGPEATWMRPGLFPRGGTCGESKASVCGSGEDMALHPNTDSSLPLHSFQPWSK